MSSPKSQERDDPRRDRHLRLGRRCVAGPRERGLDRDDARGDRPEIAPRLDRRQARRLDVQATWAVRSRVGSASSAARSCNPASSAVIVNASGEIRTAGLAGRTRRAAAGAGTGPRLAWAARIGGRRGRRRAGLDPALAARRRHEDRGQDRPLQHATTGHLRISSRRDDRMCRGNDKRQ